MDRWIDGWMDGWMIHPFIRSFLCDSVLWFDWDRTNELSIYITVIGLLLSITRNTHRAFRFFHVSTSWRALERIYQSSSSSVTSVTNVLGIKRLTESLARSYLHYKWNGGIGSVWESDCWIFLQLLTVTAYSILFAAVASPGADRICWLLFVYDYLRVMWTRTTLTAAPPTAATPTTATLTTPPAPATPSPKLRCPRVACVAS